MRLNPPERERYEVESSWPPNVWSIGLDRLDYLGVDERGQLYWNGEPLEIRRLRLTRWQRIGAFVVTISTAVAAIAAAVSAYVDWISQ